MHVIMFWSILTHFFRNIIIKLKTSSIQTASNITSITTSGFWGLKRPHNQQCTGSISFFRSETTSNQNDGWLKWRLNKLVCLCTARKFLTTYFKRLIPNKGNKVPYSSVSTGFLSQSNILYQPIDIQCRPYPEKMQVHWHLLLYLTIFLLANISA